MAPTQSWFVLGRHPRVADGGVGYVYGPFLYEKDARDFRERADGVNRWALSVVRGGAVSIQERTSRVFVTPSGREH